MLSLFLVCGCCFVDLYSRVLDVVMVISVMQVTANGMFCIKREDLPCCAHCCRISNFLLADWTGVNLSE